MGIVLERAHNKLRDARTDSLADHRKKLADYKPEKTALLAVVAGFDAAIAGNAAPINANQMVKDIRAIYTKYISDVTTKITGETGAINAIKALIAGDVVTPYTQDEKDEIAAIVV